MANLNLRYFYDHHCKGSPHKSTLWTSRCPIESANPVYEMYSSVCDLTSRTLLFIACTPLLGIKRLPTPLDAIPVVGFYYHQWLDDLKNIHSPSHKVCYSAARSVDALRLVANYNPLTRAYRSRKSCGCECQCERDRNCSNTTTQDKNPQPKLTV